MQIRKIIRDRFEKYLRNSGFYQISELTIGGHCGCCGDWIANEIYPKEWAIGLCENCCKCGEEIST